MKHNFILGTICCCLTVFMAVVSLIEKQPSLTPAVILFVATMYFAGRHMDKHHD